MIIFARIALAAAILFSSFGASAQFQDQKNWAGTSGGSANAQTLTVANWTRSLVGVPIRFLAGFTNTSATTLVITGVPAVAVNKLTAAGPVALSGGEIVAGRITEVVYDGTRYVLTYTPQNTPTIQRLTSGSAATYTKPAGVTSLFIKACGAGGGGGGKTGTGGTGGTTIFNSVNAVGGTGGGPGNVTTGNAGGAGGTAGSGSATWRIAGARGNAGSGTAEPTGGSGGVSPFGANGGSANNQVAGFAAAANSCSGGGAYGGNSSVSEGGGGGGGAGEYFELIISSPAATYTYTIGTAGTAGAGSTTGGAGGSGVINVYENYN